MGYRQAIASRLEEALQQFPEDFTQRKMFGGIAYLFKGKMTIGIINDELTVRVVASKMDTVLQNEHVRPMDFTGKPMKEFVFVGPEGYMTEQQLHHWIGLGLEHAKTKLSA